jgi:hypothetical protein
MFATNASEQGTGVPNIVPGAGIIFLILKDLTFISTIFCAFKIEAVKKAVGMFLEACGKSIG